MNPMKTLMGALPIVAAAFGRKFGIQVLVGGDRACTDGKTTIQIPAIGEDAEAATLAWGYLAHEAGHCRETDMDVYDQTARRGPLTAKILNILEDVRSENANIRTYPGSRKWLDDTIGWLAHNGRLNPAKKEDPPPQVLAASLLLMARHRYRQQAFLKDAAAEAERVLRQVFPATFVHRYLGLLTDIPGLKSTADAAELTLRIRGLIEEEVEEPPPPEPPGQPGEDGQGEGEDAGDDAGQPEDAEDEDGGDSAGQSGDDEGEGDGEGADQSGDDEGEDDGEGAGQSGSDEGEDDGDDADQSGDDEDEDGGDDAGQSGSDADQDDGQGREALRAVLSAGAGDLPGDTFEEVAKALGQHATPSKVVLLPSLEGYDGDLAQGQAALARVRGESAKLTARLQGLVQASQRTAARTVRRGNRLDPSKLYRVGVKDDRIFARREEKVAPNTAMHLLVDLSGSMGFETLHDGRTRPKDDYQVALDAAMALALALEPINGVSCAATAFPSQKGGQDRVTRILSHGDRVARRTGAFVQSARGGTPMTGALWYAAADLLARREERKVILTITDGQPADQDSAKDMVRKATAAGVEMIGVGIKVDVSHLFPVAIQIASVADLKGELFGIAEKLLLR